MVRVSARLLTHCLIMEQKTEPLYAQLPVKMEDEETSPVRLQGYKQACVPRAHRTEDMHHMPSATVNACPAGV